MKRLAMCFVIAVLLSWPVSGLAQDARKVLAVVDFEDLVHGWGSTSEVVTERVINRLREEPSVRVLPRDTVQGALSDAKVEAHGLLDPADAQRVGQALGANDVVMGQVTQFNWEHHTVSVVVGTITQQIANVTLEGRVLDVAAARPVVELESKGRLTATGGSTWVGPWWTGISVDNFDNALIGKATKESVDRFVQQVVASVK
jgi:curli biogenesis system outer membrane secretion channel CsgG